jgi:hypothetical protein
MARALPEPIQLLQSIYADKGRMTSERVKESTATAGEQAAGTPAKTRPSRAQRAYLRRGLDQPGGKLPLFDRQGQEISPQTVRACIARGWAEPWFSNPLKPDWLVCKLTDAGRAILGD